MGRLFDGSVDGLNVFSRKWRDNKPRVANCDIRAVKVLVVNWKSTQNEYVLLLVSHRCVIGMNSIRHQLQPFNGQCVVLATIP